MRNYRVYRLDAGDRIRAGAWIEAGDDQDAMTKAHAFCNHETPSIELWEGNRFVARMPCKDEAAA